jgi:ppGpp synthetase/RelA/SpoT-type nucleotidyltranferase
MTTPPLNPHPPATDDEYITWARGALGVNFSDPREELSYKQNASFIRTTAQSHDFFKGLDNFLKDYREAYYAQTGANLFMRGVPEVVLDIKSYNSAINKSFRHNVVLNKNFPAPPEGDWVRPINWFSIFNDIVRSTIVCKFIDGPQFLAEQLKDYATGLTLDSDYTTQQKDDGYYAYHYYVNIPVELLINGVAGVVNVKIEIQLTTQLQEVLYEITHRYYEHLRNQRAVDPSKWKWEVNSNRFRAGYVSHTLHLLEAIILELRDSDDTVAESNPEPDNA